MLRKVRKLAEGLNYSFYQKNVVYSISFAFMKFAKRVNASSVENCNLMDSSSAARSLGCTPKTAYNFFTSFFSTVRQYS